MKHSGPLRLIQGTVQVRPHLLPVRLAEAVAHSPLRVRDPPPEAVAVSRQFLPVTFTGRLAGEGPGPHDVDLDERRKLHLKREKNGENVTPFS